MTLQEYLDHADKARALEHILSQAKKLNKNNPALLRFEDDYIATHASWAFKKSFAGAPIVIKDNILLRDTISSFGSKIAQDYRAPYSAHVVEQLEEAGFLVIAKATMDEFAMGWSGENSPFAYPHNVYDASRVSWGSSSGSAVAVASKQVAVALGTDTGWSVRQPAAFNGIYGLKPSYGALSRYGVQAMASSFDQVGIFAQNLEDMQQVFEVIAGYDERDASSKAYEFDHRLDTLQGLKIGIPQQYFAQGLDPLIDQSTRKALDRYAAQGAELVELDLPLIDAGVSVYYTLVSAEVATNLARFDGLRFGTQADTSAFAHHDEYLQSVRSSFGPEVKRRILMGNYVLSALEYEWLYVKASSLRAHITQNMLETLKRVDIIAWPTSPVLPWHTGAKSDPVSAYLADAYTVIANLTGLPALSLPIGLVNNNGQELPVWLQLMGGLGSDKFLLDCAGFFANSSS